MTYESHVALALRLLALTLLGQYTPIHCFTSICSTPYLVTLLASLYQLLTLSYPTCSLTACSWFISVYFYLSF